MSSSSQNVDTKNKSNLQQPPAEEKIKSVLELLEEDDEFEVLNSPHTGLDLCKACVV